MKTRLAATATATAAAALASVVLGGAPAHAYGSIATLSGSNIQCREGLRSVGVAYNLQATKFNDGTILVDGQLKDPCTDGQYATLFMRELSPNGAATTGWYYVRTGSATPVTIRPSIPQRGIVSDVQVVVCRTDSSVTSSYCSRSMYLHV